MPIDYKNYPANWKTEIRPAILKRAGNCCETCKAPNGDAIFRGWYNGIECYQLFEGEVYNANTGGFIYNIGSEGIEPLKGDPNQQAIKVVLTIAHLDHDTTNNEYGNLKALCQRCHLRLDAELHKRNAAATRRAKLKIVELF